MAFNLFDLTYRVAREVGIVEEGTATGGSTTTILDTNNRTEVDDYWNSGTAWIIYDAGGAGAAPQGQYSVISDFAYTGGVVTLRSTLTAAVVASDRYAVARKRFPLNVIIQKINQALTLIGPTVVTDITSITTAANQTEYSLPNAVLDLREVYIQGDDDDANDNRWLKVYNWSVQVTATGTADLLILPYQYASGYDLKLVYVGPHAELAIYTDKLAESIPLELVVCLAAKLCLEWWRSEHGGDKRYDGQITMLEQMIEPQQMRRPPLPAKTGRIMDAGPSGVYTYEDEPNRVYLR